MNEKREDPAARFAETQKQLQEAVRPITEFQQELRKAAQPIADIQKHLQEAVRPLAELRAQIQAIRVPVFRIPEFENAVRQAAEQQQRIAESIRNIGFRSLDEFVERLARTERNKKALDAAGWLPHHTTPFDQVEDCADDTAALQSRLSAHYREEWANIRQEIETRLAAYSIDQEAKDSFREALDAHEAGLYRAVCRLLLPEIERVARVELHGNRLDRITSQPHLKHLAGQMTPASIEPRGYYSLILFERLTEHLYVHIANEAERQRFAQDPVPNRHAAIHGYVSYSSMQNSLNTIFMAEYVFQVISVLKNPSP